MNKIETVKVEWKLLLEKMNNLDDSSEEFDDLFELSNELERELFELDEFPTTDSVIQFLNS